MDLVEIGTPLVLQEGAAAIREIARDHRRLEIVADFKIMDAGDAEARIAFDAGADIVTVLGVANDATLAAVVAEARRQHRRVMVDLIAAPQSGARAAEAAAMGADYVCVHTAYDLHKTGTTPLADIAGVHTVVGSGMLAVAGGLTPDTVKALLPYRPAIVVVGSYIARHAAPREAAQAIREQFN